MSLESKHCFDCNLLTDAWIEDGGKKICPACFQKKVLSLALPEPIRVFGGKAEKIRESDLFEAHIVEIEGRRVAELRYAGNLQ